MEHWDMRPLYKLLLYPLETVSKDATKGYRCMSINAQTWSFNPVETVLRFLGIPTTLHTSTPDRRG
jgi:hypothetical protein